MSGLLGSLLSSGTDLLGDFDCVSSLLGASDLPCENWGSHPLV